MNRRCFAGWDIGGAHLKVVCVSDAGCISHALQVTAPIWQGLDILHDAIVDALHRLPSAKYWHAITMTAELADCFTDRTTGVAALLDCSERFLGNETRVYRPGGLCDLTAARQMPDRIGSCNWHVAAELVGQCQDQALLIDIGSTTSDIVGIRDGCPAVCGYTDRERMQYDELVYTGVVRTPVMAVAQRAVVAGVEQHLACEQFAVMADIYRLTGELPPGADQWPTADGGSRDYDGSARRLARMAGTDMAEVSSEDWRMLAIQLKKRQLQLLKSAATRVIARAGLDDDAAIIGAGCGRFLVAQLAHELQRPYVDAASCFNVNGEFQEQAADMLPAYALAEMLCREQAD